MGNSSSNSAHNPHRRSTTAAPLVAPPPPAARSSRPLKSKKRSIVDHPALLAAATPSPSSPIPIPTHAGQPPPQRPPPPPNNDSSDVVPELLHSENHTHRPLQYNSTRSFGGVRRGGVQGGGWTHDSPSTVRHAPAFMPEVVRCSIPLRIAGAARGHKPLPKGVAEDLEEVDDENEGLVPTPIVWRGGGKEVLLAGTFDPLEWRARERMRFDPTTSTHSLTLHLPPGTYRIKFIVDDAWHCSDDMPTATDDKTGNLVNYVDVEDSSALDTADGDDVPERQGRDGRVMKANRRRTYPSAAHKYSPTTLPPPPRFPYHPPLLPPSESTFWADLDTDTELEGAGWERGRDGLVERWTSAVPEPLIAAAQQEEAYVAAVQTQREARRGGAGTRGTLGALGMGVPNIPPAPRLPRHLDKVILNTRHSHAHAAGGGSSHAGRSSRSGKHRSSRAGAATANGNGTGLGMSSLLSPDAALAAGLEKTGSAAAMEQWAQADDSSVLPVPSHVVLHHLGTSAIKNGVLAVSDTTRYNKKYITTIYYKPT